MNIQFPKSEIEAEERRPKRKVAVMVGYAGTGYHGMQINHKEKTIEGDIFAAFVAANAISKANADDPKKSSLVRCARTDKGVHAAGNVISLKLIIEEPDIVKKINDALPPQIRVWGIQRTNNGFSCYQACDSRWYEYLMPSYCLLPPHPESFLGKKVLSAIKEKGAEEEYVKRMAEDMDFWEGVEKNDIQPIIDGLEPEVREEVLRQRHAVETDPSLKPNAVETESASATNLVATSVTKQTESTDTAGPETSTAAPVEVETSETQNGPAIGDPETSAATLSEAPASDSESALAVENLDASQATPIGIMGVTEAAQPQAFDMLPWKPKELSPVELALKQIKAAYVAAKRRYRVTPHRLSQLQQALDQYVGTRNFHNYTVQKSANDPSAKRSIKSFVVNPEPVQINDTQWLSLKVHGQSFMMHQIRKMVGMAVLLTRCGTELERIPQSYQTNRISIPKAPSLGLLLERPVFENYNNRAKDSFDKPEIDFGNYEEEIQKFKDEYIYRHMFALEEKENSFHSFFHQIDNFKSDYFLWVTAGGIAAAHARDGPAEDAPEGMKEELGDEGEDPEGGEG
ncbi:pseudouridine synthase [Xylariales sp. AK1849]|nr:pseudouridine synthase [Xylariales sp. AK1849]